MKHLAYHATACAFTARLLWTWLLIVYIPFMANSFSKTLIIGIQSTSNDTIRYDTIR